MAFYAVAPCVLAKDQAGRIHYHYESVNPVIPWLSDDQAEHFLAEGLVVEIDDPVDPEPEPAEPVEPKRTAPKAKWVTWAVYKGADPDEAKAASQADLVALYGTPVE
jgi:hypothetical protein